MDTKVETESTKPKLSRDEREKLKLQKQIKEELQLHYNNIAERNRLASSVETTLKRIKEIDSIEKKRVERIIKDANLIDIATFEIKNIIVKIVFKLKYKRPQPDYKDLWNYVLEHVGSTLRKKLQKIEYKMVETKAKEKEQVLEFEPIK